MPALYLKRNRINHERRTKRGTGVPKLRNSSLEGIAMNNPALWKMLATLLVMVADLMIEKIVKGGRKEREK